MTAPWWAALPPAEARIHCGTGEHALRWADGTLTASSHPDAEGELVLAALGGDQAECIAMTQSWQAHADDLDVLALGPRSPADQLSVTWERLSELRSAMRMTRGAYSTPARIRHAAISASLQGLPDDQQRARARREELLVLFALGQAFQLRLSAAVAASWAAAGRDITEARPALIAALTGRLAPVAGSWLGIAAGQVHAALHDGPGWGAAERTGPDLQVALPVSWLARVWAPGFPVVGGHLVVDVLDAAWPWARVLGLSQPGAEPAELNIQHDGEDWSVAGDGS